MQYNPQSGTTSTDVYGCPESTETTQCNITKQNWKKYIKIDEIKVISRNKNHDMMQYTIKINKIKWKL